MQRRRIQGDHFRHRLRRSVGTGGDARRAIRWRTTRRVMRSDTDDRDRAVRLIWYRALDVETPSGGAKGFLEAIKDERQLAGLLHAVLEIFASIKRVLRPGVAGGLVAERLSDISTFDQSTDRRPA